jgi:predicted glycosyltransferase
VRRRKVVLVYAQHLSGVGHHVRIREIARALAEDHRVCFVQGGMPVPRPSDGGKLERVELPPIRRGRQGLEPLDPSRGIDDVMRARVAGLRRAAAEIAPDVLVVEHYPFSKWELEPEIDAMIDAARAANPRVELVCSARDILRKTRHECVSPELYRRRITGVLNERFDALFVHGDPSFTRLEEHFEGAGDLGIPVVYTGFVSEKPDPVGEEAPARREAAGADGGWVIVSTGGGSGSGAWVARVVEAWERIAARGADGGRRMRVFPGLYWTDREVAALEARAGAGRCVVAPFSADFLRWVRRADLSISRAGYNTCVNVLEARSRAVLVPDPRMSDQPFRARRFVEHGLAEVVWGEEPSVEELADAIGKALRRERPEHAFDLDGARRTRELLNR